MFFISLILYHFLVTFITYTLLSNYLFTIKKISIYTSGLIFENFILFLIFLVLYITFKRKLLALLLTTAFYLIFITSNIVKIKTLGTPIYPNDFFLIGDLLLTWQVLVPYIPYMILGVLTLSAIIYWSIKKQKKEKVYSKTIFMSLFVLISYGITFHSENIRLFLREHGIFHKKNVNLVVRGLKYGFLSNFVQATFFIGKPIPPDNYSKKNILAIVDKYKLDNTFYSESKIDNVIILLIESFTDPKQFGWHFSESPVPYFDEIVENHISGIAFSPVYGGKSINAEFELMTGLSNRFTPIETSPYQEFVDKNIPSLARTFSHNGFTTNAIQMVKFKGFGYGKIYDYLGVDNKISLSTKNNPALKPDPSGRSVSSIEIAKNIHSLLTTQDKSFIFAFPNSSHSPWELKHYPDSSLKLLNGINDESENDTVLAYANAMKHIDSMFGEIISSIEKIDEKTLLVIVGDHQPGISIYGNYLKNDNTQTPYINNILKKYKTSFAIWSNFLEPKDKTNTLTISLNLIPGLIIEKSGINHNGFMKFITHIHRQFDVISHTFKLKNNKHTEDLSSRHQEIVSDYELLQYDILFGENYIYSELKN